MNPTSSLTWILITFSFFSIVKGVSPNACGSDDWIPYADSKCFKLLPQFVTWLDAVSVCQSQEGANAPQIATIKSAEEQAFAARYLFNDTGAVNSIWLGARRTELTPDFEWIDGTPVDFSNWEDGTPEGVVGDGRDCVQMESGRKNIDSGYWRNVDCGHGNWVLCEKLQPWSAEDVQRILMELQLEVETQKAELMQLKSNPVPIGFIYTELPGQPQPQTIWPQLTWTDISSTLEGQFFRVFGPESAQFGEMQEAQWPRISQVTARYGFDNGTIDLPFSGWSPNLYVGSRDGDMSISFFVDEKENRPKNTAVRLWKRTA